jgi:hypothetical protein
MIINGVACCVYVFVCVCVWLGTLVESPRMDATLCFSDTRDKQKAELWDGGDVGGFECYIAAEDDTDADATAEVYKTEKEGEGEGEGEDEEEDGDLLSVQAGCNVLNIVMRDEGVMKFVKYVSHKAPSRYYTQHSASQRIPSLLLLFLPENTIISKPRSCCILYI